MRAPLAAVLVVLAALLGGIWLGGHSASLPGPLQDFARDDDLAVVDAAIERVHDDYYRDVPKKELADEAIRGMVSGLDDRFSAYFDPKEYAKFREVTDARFSGIGVSIQRIEGRAKYSSISRATASRRLGAWRIRGLRVAANTSRTTSWFSLS